MAAVSTATEPTFPFPEPREFPSLKLLFHLTKYLQEHQASGQSPQNTCRQIIGHTSALYGGIYKRIKDVDASPGLNKEVVSTFKTYADALEILEE